MTAKNTIEHFYEQIDKHGPIHPILGTRCHLWTGFCNKDGYGRFRYAGEYILVHRMLYEIKHGKLPKGKCVLHHCDNPPCLRDEHLFAGSIRKNNQDCTMKGRHAKGSKHGRSKLTEEDIPRIRRKWKSGKYSRKALAAKFGISIWQISRVVHRQAWEHV